MTKTKIIATIGPASNKYSIIKNMVLAGMDIARINTKYGSKTEYLEIIDNIQKINKKQNKNCQILFDVKKPTILKWLSKQDFDYMAIAFADNKDKVLQYTKILGKKDVKVIAKIETKKGINNLDDLLNVSYGIMVARGDLGKNVVLERLPIYQKQIIKHCNQNHKFVITATEMLLSMQNNKIPERAEVSDVANAVLDGTNAVMLSEETAIGKYPVNCVKVMNKIINETEKYIRVKKNK